ncbi:MAG: TrkH family potassium uptake protein, partial [Erysipelotrichaceae bacterium]|nr:TrkH family potassium uptake protein [Erysipelotrichaceae bacterium]
MNIGMLIYIIGWALNLVGGFMIIPIVTALFYQEPIYPFLLTAGICLVFGIPMTLRKIKTYQLHAKDGCIAVSLSWVVISVFGMLPFLIGGSIPNVIDALFETVSGFTTTGASILNDVECLPYSIIMWRSFTHWVGGMGLLVFFLALIRLPGGSHMNLMKAESPGPSVSKLVPKIQSTAVILYAIYFGLTLLEIV